MAFTSSFAGDSIVEGCSAANENGAADARRDIEAGHIHYYSGAPSQGWGLDLAELLLARFGIEVIFTSCLVTDESVAFENGYNAVVEAHVDGARGKDAFAKALAEVERIRHANYLRYFDSNPPVTLDTSSDS